MSRASRRAACEKELATLEAKFSAQLVDALRKSAAGRWGLFGPGEALVYNPRTWVKEINALRDLGGEIEALRAKLGHGSFPLNQRYLHFSKRRGPNDPGDPKLAAEFLREIE